LGPGKFSLFDPTRTQGKLMQKIVILLFALLVYGCKSSNMPKLKNDSRTQKEPIKSKQIDLVLRQLLAHDIQENSTFYDELFLTYSLSVIEKDCVVQASHASYAVGRVQKGNKLNLDSIPTLHLELKEGQKLGVQIALWEIDDYSKSQKFLKKVSLVGEAFQWPLKLIEWSSSSNPLGWFLWGTRLSSIGLDFLVKLDKDDLLGISEVIWDWEDLPIRKATRFKRIEWQGRKSAINSFHYEFSYEIKVKDILK
jgi:hypothetical protein